MRRPVLLVVMAIVGLTAAAQPDVSLTPEFAGLSAKERARLAKKEVEEAAEDTRFQTVMAEAESLFKLHRYDESLTRFQQARALRPLNVYPKVKIQDLQALIAKRDAAAQYEDPIPQDTLAPDAETSESPQAIAAETPSAVEPLPKPEPRTLYRDERKAEKPVRELPKKPEPPSVGAERVAAPVNGLQERTFMEGRAIVLERRLIRGGVEAVYRKVSHPWGQVMHFRDGSAISEREWTSVFGVQ